MKKVNLVQFPEIIQHATTLGYKWNDACNLLNDVRPMFEITSMEYRLDEEDEWREDFEFSEEVITILKSFMNKKKVKEITVVND